MTTPTAVVYPNKHSAHSAVTSSADVVIFGETLIDEFPSERVVGGAPFNVARTLAGLGQRPLLLSRLGQDSAARDVLSEMRRFGLDQSGMQIDSVRPTGKVTVELKAASHQFHILPDQAYDYIDAEQVCSALTSAFPSKPPRCIYFGSLAQRQPTSRAALRAMLASTDALVFLDLNLRDGQFTPEVIIESLALANVVKLNEDELRLLLQQTAPGSEDLYINLEGATSRVALHTVLLTLINQFSLQALIVTLGERGYVYLNQNGEMLYNSAKTTAIEVVDTVGCGDAFSAVFIVGLLQGWLPKLALERAHAFATSICTVRGAVAADMAFYQTWLQLWNQDKESTL